MTGNREGNSVAEQEIAKHTKNIIGLFGRDQHPQASHGWRHKLSEVLLEIVTIVFAVSLSIWLHSLGEHRHEQEQVRNFLLGLRHDLKSDINALGQIQAFYHQSDSNFSYLSQLDAHAAPEAEKFEQAYLRADANLFFNPLTSRYQGFKSSGKLGNIEDEKLMEKLLDLYENRVTQIRFSENGWSGRQNTYRAYLENELDGDDSVARHYRLATAPKGRRLLRQQIAPQQLYERYAAYAAEAADIVKAIEQAYPAYLAKDDQP